MTGRRGKKNEHPDKNENGFDTDDDSDKGQQASKKEVRRTQKLVTDLEGKIEDLNETLDNLTEKLGSADSKFSQHELRLAFLEAKTKTLHEENKQLRDRVDQLENDKRGNNLKTDGIRENDQENLSDTVLKLAAAIGVRCQPTDIDFIYRIGKVENGDRARPRPRPILVHFKSRAVRDNIFFGRSKLRGKDEWKYTYVNDDVNESTRKKR